MLARGCRDLQPAQHAGDLLDPCFEVQRGNVRFGCAIDQALAHAKMVLSARRDLRQVGHAEHLVA